MKIRVALLVVVGLLQLAVPGWMIFQQEQTLRLGKEFKLETEPVDPYDVFRGRYVALRFKAEEVDHKGEPNIPSNSRVYVAIKANAAGFAEVDRIDLNPIKGDNVFQAVAQNGWRSKNLHLRFPFEHYYMEETRAPEAEKAYRSANRRNSAHQTYAVVRIWHGNAALADLMIDGQPIREYLRDHPQSKK